MNGDVPKPRFGHTTAQISKTKVVLFGGATGDTGRYSITGDAYLFDSQYHSWRKLDTVGVAPSPRAAHASCALELLQMVVYGGATGGGSLASDDLYLLDLRNGDDKASWMIVPIVGSTPGRRQGHVIVYSKPHLLVFGGNTGSEPVSDVWCLNVERAPFSWARLDCSDHGPCKRVQHSASVCSTGSASGMMVIFGGRGPDSAALNDTWGLRRHRDGKWDWVKAPYKNTNMAESPLSRYQHTTLFCGSFMVVIGGRTQQVNDKVFLEVQDTESSEWYRFLAVQRFRHSSWIVDSKIYIHGGFEPEAPSIPTDVINSIELKKLFESSTSLSKAFKNLSLGDDKKKPRTENLMDRPYSKESQSGENMEIKWNPTAIVFRSENKDFSEVVLDDLSEISKKIQKDGNKGSYIKHPKSTPNNVYELFIRDLLKPKTWKPSDNNAFNFNPEMIHKLCEETEEVIKKQPIVLRVSAPIKIFGDIHGQYRDLMKFFDLYGSPCNKLNGGDIDSNDYLFLGDQVDRGTHSLETLCLLFALKCKYPDRVHMIRGNHEDKFINNNFGFADECRLRLGEDPFDQEYSVFNSFNRVFEQLPMAAVIDEKILCIHGGIGATLKDIGEIEKLKRPLEIVHEVQQREHLLVVDILWSDPTDSDDDKGILPNHVRDPNQSGNIVKFGPDRVQDFCKANGIDQIIRAHECVMDGIEQFADGQLITVFSATDQCNKHKNTGGMLHLNKHLKFKPQLILPETNNQKNWQGEEDMKKRPPTPPRWREGFK